MTEEMRLDSTISFTVSALLKISFCPGRYVRTCCGKIRSLPHYEVHVVDEVLAMQVAIATWGTSILEKMMEVTLLQTHLQNYIRYLGV